MCYHGLLVGGNLSVTVSSESRGDKGVGGKRYAKCFLIEKVFKNLVFVFHYKISSIVQVLLGVLVEFSLRYSVLVYKWVR